MEKELSHHEFKLARILACRNVRLASQLAHTCKKGVVPLVWRPRILKSSFAFSERGGLVALPNYEAWYLYRSVRREATIWHIVTCLMKGNVEAAKKQAPESERRKLMKLAGWRKEALQKWVLENPKAAEAMCAPLIAEYAERAKRRAEKEAQV